MVTWAIVQGIRGYLGHYPVYQKLPGPLSMESGLPWPLSRVSGGYLGHCPGYQGLPGPVSMVSGLPGSLSRVSEVTLAIVQGIRGYLGHCPWYQAYLGHFPGYQWIGQFSGKFNRIRNTVADCKCDSQVR